MLARPQIAACDQALNRCTRPGPDLLHVQGMSTITCPREGQVHWVILWWCMGMCELAVQEGWSDEAWTALVQACCLGGQ